MKDETGNNIFEQGQVLLFDKPVQWTSFDLVNKVRIMIRNTLGINKIKVGHTGTLDPLASGLMILCTGKATKKIEEFRNLDKEYLATLMLGATTPSYDLETDIDNIYPTAHITEESIRDALSGFTGEREQVPPMHSAKFIDGRRAYEFARKGEIRELKPVKVNFREVELIDYRIPEVKVRIVCSKGTFIRAFARDIGEALGSGAYLSDLRRLSIGSNSVEQAYNLDKFEFFLKQMKQI